jgi:ATP-dependent RNA helicase RhlE
LTLFSDFGLAAPIEKALAGEGYTTPTPIQTQAIPFVMNGRDLCGIAQTGTGKTAAFALPMLHRLSQAPKKVLPRTCRALVLSPTRELAGQIAESFQAYGRHLRIATAVVYGGVPVGKNERALAQGVDVLVATPGRLLDLIDRRSLALAGVEILVLDEADQMLDLGFIHDLKRIVRLLPKERQTLFFSATMPKTIASLAEDFLRNPAHVAVAPVATTAERVDQQVVFVSSGQKQQLLHTLLRDPAIDRALVFTRTKHGANKVVRHLEDAGFKAAAIHGNKSQAQRERALADFKAGKLRLLVATDIAARGIDIEAVSHVINFDLPNVPESYVHRIGRTARAGAAGIAISFCNSEERAYLKDIEKLTRQHVPVMPLPAGFSAEPAPRPVASEPRAQQPHHRAGRRGQQRSEQGSGARHGQPASQKSQRHHADGGKRSANGNGDGKQHQRSAQGRPAARTRQDGAARSEGGSSIRWLSR